MSMLDVMVDRLGEAGRTLEPLCRVCFVGRLREGVEKSSHQMSCTQQISAMDDDKPITGLLLTVPGAWIHLVEGAHKSVASFLRSLHADALGLFECIRVIHAAEDVAQRHFSSWKVKEVSAARNDYAELDSKNLPGLLGETVIGEAQLCSCCGRLRREGGGATNCVPPLHDHVTLCRRGLL
jgi:hypothetical protein